MAKKQAKVAVSERAVVQRVNRVLAKEMECIRKHRTAQWHGGNYYHVDLNRNYCLAEHVDLETFALEVGAMKPWETIETE